MKESRSILIIGSGRRVQEDALPALSFISDIRVHRILANTAKTIVSGSKTYIVEPFHELKKSDLEKSDLIYLAVKQSSVIPVLQKITSFDVSGVDIIVETPVLPFGDLSRVSLFNCFNNVWGAEDCTRLPFFDVLKQFKEEIQKVTLERSAYKYHGIALLKMLLKCSVISRAKRELLQNGKSKICFHFNNGKQGFLTEPRNYKTGYLKIETTNAIIADCKETVDSDYLLAPLLENGYCKGFGLKGLNEDLNVFIEGAESQLMGHWMAHDTITSKMYDLKRVGLYRMFNEILRDGGTYSLSEALNDRIISYYIDNLNFYRSSSLLAKNPRIGHLWVRLLNKSNSMFGKKI